MVPSSIEIRHDGSYLHIPRENVFFSFANGRLTYDCRACPTHCCRQGFGYWLNSEEERQSQLTDRPYLQFFLEPDPRPGYQKLHNHPPGCFFLSDDGHCSIHRDKGPAAKPLTCQLFPFNRMLLVENLLVVGARASACPIQAVPIQRKSPLSSHDFLFRTMARHGMDRSIFCGRGLMENLSALVDLERRIVELSEEALKKDIPLSTFIDEQFGVTQDLLESLRGSLSECAGLFGSSAEEMARLATEVLGVPEIDVHSFDRGVRQSVIAATPILRAALVFFQTTGPRVREGGLVSIERIPFAILAVAILCQLAKLAGMVQVTVQTASHLARKYREVVWAMAHLDAAPRWGNVASNDVGFIATQRGTEGAFGNLAADLLPARQRGAELSFIDLLRKHSEASSAIERNLLFKLAAKRMYARVEVS